MTVRSVFHRGASCSAHWEALLCRRHIIEDEIDAPLGTFIHHAVLLLIIDLIDTADLEAVGPSRDHKAHSGIGINRNMDSVAVMK